MEQIKKMKQAIGAFMKALPNGLAHLSPVSGTSVAAARRVTDTARAASAVIC